LLLRQGDRGLLGQLAQGSVEETLSRIEEAARQRPLIVTYLAAATDQEETAGTEDESVGSHGDRVGPALEVLDQGEAFAAHVVVAGGAQPLREVVEHRRRDIVRDGVEGLTAAVTHQVLVAKRCGREDAFANVFSVEGSVGSLLGDAASLHKRFPAVFPRDGLDRLKAVFGVLQALCQGNGPDQIMSMAEMPGLMKELTSALLDAVKAKPGASKKMAAAAAGTREAKRVRAMAASLGVAEDAIAKGATWAAAYLHWSPKKAYPRVSVGKLWLDQELHYLWSVVAKRTALVSGTLYEENPSYSCETVRRALAVPIGKVVQMVPIHARWQVDPVELRMVPAVHGADGRPRYVRPSAKQEESVRGAEGAKWLDDVSGYVRELLLTNATAGGVLVLGTAFADIEGVEQRLKTGTGVPAGWTVLAQRPGVGLAGLRKEFMEASRIGKVALLAVGGAWTGFDLHSNESPDALTDLVILNAPFGLMGRTVARLRRQASKTGHFEVASHALLLVRQGVGRLVRSPETPHNRRIHWLDARIYEPSLAGMFYGIKRFLGRYRSIAVA
jgi:CRISPR type IV-associated DEAD/DEAH-box helicase Csf4